MPIEQRSKEESENAPKQSQQTKSSGSSQTRATIVLGMSALLLALIFILVPRLPDQQVTWRWVQFLCGSVVSPTLILIVIRLGYLLARRMHWLHRQAKEKKYVDELRTPSGVKKSEEYDHVAEIDKSQKSALAKVPDSQGAYRARALTTYAAPAVAVLFAGLHVVVWPNDSFGAGLVLGEALLITFVILRIIIDRRPAQKWIEQRVRGELFRRDQYLHLARVGPYYPGKLEIPETRINLIATASLDLMTELLAMEYADSPDRNTWLDYLSSQPSSDLLFNDLLDRVKTYQYFRVGKQIAWMRSATEDVQRSARQIEWFVAAAAMANVLVATVIAFWQLGAQALAANAAPTVDNVGMLAAAVALSVFLPAFSGMLLALQSVFNLRVLSENYRVTELALERLRVKLMELEEEVAQNGTGADTAAKCRNEKRFQKLVLRVEGQLTEELVRWRMITQRDAHELV